VVFRSGGNKEKRKAKTKVYSPFAFKGFQSLRDGYAALDGGRIVVPIAGNHNAKIFVLGLALNMFKSSLCAKV
jgi:hypothetical protein